MATRHGDAKSSNLLKDPREDSIVKSRRDCSAGVVASGGEEERHL
jgi:hypothetical protein